VRSILLRLKGAKKSAVAFFISFLLLVEYASFPIPLESVPVKKNIPEVYQWLAVQKESFALLELPLPAPHEWECYIEGARVYYSIYHWKKLVNGYSSFFPPFYEKLRIRWRDLPLEKNVKDTKYLGIRYIIFHSSSYPEEEFQQILWKLKQLDKDLRFIWQFGEAYVYELVYTQNEREQSILRENEKPLLRDGWKARSNINRRKAGNTIDGDLRTRWSTRYQKKGCFLLLDLGHIHHIRGLSLKLGEKPLHFPRHYIVQLSANGKKWWKAAKDDTDILPIKALLRPKDISLDIFFAPKAARYIRIMISKEDLASSWSVYELEVYKE
jgi:hypothetical protein